MTAYLGLGESSTPEPLTHESSTPEPSTAEPSKPEPSNLNRQTVVLH